MNNHRQQKFVPPIIHLAQQSQQYILNHPTFPKNSNPTTPKPREESTTNNQPQPLTTKITKNTSPLPTIPTTATSLSHPTPNLPKTPTTKTSLPATARWDGALFCVFCCSQLSFFLFSLLLRFEAGREIGKRRLTNHIILRSTAGRQMNQTFSKSVNRIADWIVDWFSNCRFLGFRD